MTNLESDRPSLGFGSAEFVDDPYPAYARLRRDSPVSWDAQHRFWAVTSYDGVSAALSTPGVFSSAIVSSGGLDPIIDRPAIMLCDDPPVHTYYRNLLKGGFAGSRVPEIETSVRHTAGELVDQMARKLERVGTVDFVSSLASPLAVVTGAAILGVPISRRPVEEWMSSTAIPAEMQGDQAARASLRSRLIGVFRQLYREDPRLLLSAMLEPEAAGNLSEEEMVRLTFMLWISAVEAPPFLFTNAMAALAAHPEIRQSLIANPAWIPAFVEEVLRFDPPVQGLFRRATQDTELGGTQIKAGDAVWLFFASANRDEKYFPDPERFDALRFQDKARGGASKPHFAFGGGIHSCMGAHLARIEVTHGLRILLERLPNLVTLPARGRRSTHPVMRGFNSLPVTVV